MAYFNCGLAKWQYWNLFTIMMHAKCLFRIYLKFESFLEALLQRHPANSGEDDDGCGDDDDEDDDDDDEDDGEERKNKSDR